MEYLVYYEAGYDESNILGSGTNYYPLYQGRNKEQAFYIFNHTCSAYLTKIIKKDKKIIRKYYNSYKNKWE